jgi:uncharacterized protein (DUF924 family)
MTDPGGYTPDQVLDFWYPDTDFWSSRETFAPWIECRMQGGMDDRIVADFADLTVAAARGELDHWADTPRGRLALILALDQFPRSLWRGTPAAYAQDIKATRLVLEALENGHYETYAGYERLFLLVALSHCEGPDHLARFDIIDRISADIVAALPEGMQYAAPMMKAQNERVRAIIERFGRHPHRNPVYGRVSTPAEEAYIAEGDFPHVPSKTPE